MMYVYFLFAVVEKKPEQSEAVTVLTDEQSSPSPVPVKGNSGEFVAHEVKLVTPNANLNPSPTPASSNSFPGGIAQEDFPAASAPQGNTGLNGPRQPARNYGVVPSFLLVPKRRVLHNVRSNMKATVPGRFVIRITRIFFEIQMFISRKQIN